MDLTLTDKLTLISGSTAGIGYAVAATMLQEGARVIINGRSRETVDAAVDQLHRETGGFVQGFAGDLGSATQADKVARQFPGVEILINNLGVIAMKPFEELTDEDWMSLFNINCLSGVRLARLYLPAMKAARWGRIIFIGSESGVRIPPEVIHYGVSKAAQLAAARGLAAHVADFGITVNSILPGPTMSRGVSEFLATISAASGKPQEVCKSEFFDQAVPDSLIKRFIDCNEVARLVAYLASPLSSATTGAALRIDGGILKCAL